MPVVRSSSYQPPAYLCNGHVQSIYPNLVRRVRGVAYRRSRIATPDGDFLDLDYSMAGAGRIAIVAHGLEGDSHRSYVLGMVRALNRHGWDAVAWNLRGCSGEPNRKLRSYHSGDSQDLHTVIEHVVRTNGYRHVSLVGFSLGGNIMLKYLGEKGAGIDSTVCAAVVFSVPCDLASAARKMSSRSNSIYMRRFLRMLHQKIRMKMELFPGEIHDRHYYRIRTFKDFDARYTAPLNGFTSAEDYWRKASSEPFLPAITVPTLLVNALDDPFLSPSCYPYTIAENHPHLFLETPKTGGHVGFISFSHNGMYWSEMRATQFLGQFCR